MNIPDEKMIEQLVFDRSFRNWVLFNDPVEAVYWKDWLNKNPDKLETVNYAKALLYALHLEKADVSAEEVDREVEKILIRTKTLGPDPLPAEDPSTRNSKVFLLFNSPWFKVAAVFIIVSATIVLFIRNGETSSGDYHSYISKVQESSIAYQNTTDVPMNITLPDATDVSITPGSRLSYAVHPGNKREVYMTGEAFFNVTKDPSKPFFVYTEDFVAKVLGTSFTVKSFKGEKKGLIVVKTGKVSVILANKFSAGDAQSKILTGIVLTPNQQVIYDDETKDLKKVLVDTPALINPAKENFQFNSTPIAQVFSRLQKAYGITIVYDEEIMSGCSLSAGFGEESFYDKLEMICKTINATYVIMDGNIVISSTGCK